MSDSVAQLERLAKQHGVTVTVRANGHVQARGSILVNWYPNSRKAVMYVAGTVKGVKYATPMQVIDAAIGKHLPKIPTVERRKVTRTRSSNYGGAIPIAIGAESN